MRHLNKKIVALIDGNKVRITFDDISRMADERNVPSKYCIGDRKYHDDSIEKFADNFTKKIYPNYKNITFKVSFNWFGVTFWEVKSLDRERLFEITKPFM